MYVYVMYVIDLGCKNENLDSEEQRKRGITFPKSTEKFCKVVGENFYKNLSPVWETKRSGEELKESS